MAGSNDITTDASVATAKKSASYFRKLLQDMHRSPASDSLREADYRGHHIAIRTTYEITIDGQPFTGELGVTNAGNVHYHGMPNTSFTSALDLVKSVIDTFPAQFGPHASDHNTPMHDGHSEHGHDHGNMAAMPMAARGARRKAAPARGRRAASSRPAKKGRR